MEDILAWTEAETLQKIYNLPEFSSVPEFLMMFALSSGQLLKVRGWGPYYHYIQALNT